MTDFADMPKLNYTGKTVIKYSINLPANGTHNYTIQIKYLSSDEERVNNILEILKNNKVTPIGVKDVITDLSRKIIFS